WIKSYKANKMQLPQRIVEKHVPLESYLKSSELEEKNLAAESKKKILPKQGVAADLGHLISQYVSSKKIIPVAPSLKPGTQFVRKPEIFKAAENATITPWGGRGD